MVMKQSIDLSLRGQSFIVTGAARGIGLAVSEFFANLGANVVGWDIDPTTIKNNSFFAGCISVDVTSQESVEAAFEKTLYFVDELDGIVANAGINGPTKPTWDYDLTDWQKVIDVDLTGVFISTRPVVKYLRKKGKGRIIIMSSIAGKDGNPGACAYGSAKAGVVGFAKGLARELLPSEITVNCIAPAITETDLFFEMDQAYINEKKSKIPMNRFCTVKEIAQMTAWVASPFCSFTTGQVFDVTGGRSTW